MVQSPCSLQDFKQVLHHCQLPFPLTILSPLFNPANANPFPYRFLCLLCFSLSLSPSLIVLFFSFFCMPCRGSCESKTQSTTRGARVGRTKQRGTETSGDLWKGEGWGGIHRVNKMVLHGFSGPYTTGTFRKENREFEGGGFVVE